MGLAAGPACLPAALPVGPSQPCLRAAWAARAPLPRLPACLLPCSEGVGAPHYVYGSWPKGLGPRKPIFVLQCREGMGRQEAEDLVATALALAMARDGSSGGVIRCVAATQQVSVAAQGNACGAHRTPCGSRGGPLAACTWPSWEQGALREGPRAGCCLLCGPRPQSQTRKNARKC